MHVALAAGGDAVRVDEGGGTLPDAPWFVREGARACAARALRDPDALRGHVALVFRRAVPAAAAYGDALGILASMRGAACSAIANCAVAPTIGVGW